MSGDTIYALATARGVGGVAVIRISGPSAAACLNALAGHVPPPRYARLLSLHDPFDGGLLDRALVLWFPNPGSFTGEDVVELHLHGGRAVVNSVLSALSRVTGCRPAEAGEFTRRAFANGKLDLTAVEGLGDLIAAETEAQRRQAIRQMDGALGRLYDGWSHRLIDLLARIEAEIDFVDEEDVPDSLIQSARKDLTDLADKLANHLRDGRRGERLRDGLSVAILGAPNAGKSSLLNALAGREAAIVSERAGTTRDIIELHLDLAGYPVVLADTAGLRITDDPIEQEGIRRAEARAGAADLTLLLVDRGDWPSVPAAIQARLSDARVLALISKCDDGFEAPDPWIAISAASGFGLDRLIAAIAGVAEDSLGGEALVPTRERHRAAVQAAEASLRRAVSAPLPELLAEDVRLAVRELGRITGRVDVEDILDRIFSAFCIGK
ncbi:tRNA uridine-5-carboxymethylaminomethyl(34) synthesis GTPase MnmE [Lacibacterium aquatile]|uniref:tRNA modification GTPase MnmE n=1 Tax=Lacibacterium aquatile TaxID=1168082 RepID=A0ABW5DX54_9PROT